VSLFSFRHSLSAPQVGIDFMISAVDRGKGHFLEVSRRVMEDGRPAGA
jgi:hypothetical protein